MITIFTIPKAFKGHIGLIQRNALQSWTSLDPRIEVILCGDDDGVEAAAHLCGTRFIGDIARSEWGTPLLRSAFDRVRKIAQNDLLCFVNADIIFLQDFLEGTRRLKYKRFLMVGQRWDLDLTHALNFELPIWQSELITDVRNRGIQHPPFGSDYFVFRRDDDTLCALPAFAVGRPGWDCWLIYHARNLGMPVIDASYAIRPIHQNHDYRHVPKASGSTEDGKLWQGPEVERHKQLIGKEEHYFTPLDATHVLTARGVKRAIDYAHLQNRWKHWPVLNPAVAPLFLLIDKAIPSAIKRSVRSRLPDISRRDF
jgi:hypothetical protein